MKLKDREMLACGIFFLGCSFLLFADVLLRFDAYATRYPFTINLFGVIVLLLSAHLIAYSFKEEK